MTSYTFSLAAVFGCILIYTQFLFDPHSDLYTVFFLSTNTEAH